MAMTHEQRVEAGRKGGRKTALKYGPVYMSLIGSKGYETLCRETFGGDSIKCQAWLNKSKGMPRLNKATDGQNDLLNARCEAIESGRFNRIRKEG